jgi:hypothetical protein
MALIRSKIANNQQWLRLIRSSLPTDLATHTLACVFKNDSIIIYAESANWATKLRFHSHRVLITINRLDQVKIKKIVVRITAAGMHHPAKQRQRSLKKPSPACLVVIEQSADGTHGDLQIALSNLAKTLRSEHKIE